VEAAEVVGPVPAVGRAGGVDTGDAHGGVVRAEHVRVVAGRVPPAVKYGLSGRVTAGDVFALPGVVAVPADLAHALPRVATDVWVVGVAGDTVAGAVVVVIEVGVDAQVCAHPVGRRLQLPVDRKRTEAVLRAIVVYEDDERLLLGVEELVGGGLVSRR
jgi:hypothetical protein